MTPTAAIWVGACLLVISVLRLVYRVFLHSREAVRVRRMRHFNADMRDHFMVQVELRNGPRLEVEVTPIVYENLEVGDSMVVSYQDLGPQWWGATAYSGTRTAAALVPGLFLALSIGLIIWGVTHTG